MIRVPTKDEVRVLLERTGLPDPGAVDRANALGWGEPLRGCALFVPTGPMDAWLHVLVAPEARGREALENCRQILTLVTEAGLLLHGATPLALPQAVLFAKMVGMKEVGRDDEFVYTEA